MLKLEAKRSAEPTQQQQSTD